MIEIDVIINTRATEIVVRGPDYIPRSGIFSPAGIELIEAFMEYLKEVRGAATSRLACGNVILMLGLSWKRRSCTYLPAI